MSRRNALAGIRCFQRVLERVSKLIEGAEGRNALAGIRCFQRKNVEGELIDQIEQDAIVVMPLRAFVVFRARNAAASMKARSLMS